MKKTLVLSLLLLLGVTFLHAQETCPPGYTATGATFNIDKINFHKPRTDCKSGFGFCVRGHWTVKCKADHLIYATKLKEGNVDIWFEIKDGKLELHLPVALKNDDEFIGQDMSLFVIEEDSINLLDANGKKIATLKTGEYEVQETEADLIITIDLL